tara:strand:+ start:2783 stop:3250 length:468 start_codon:yes stop_codon:yes gene_type:complete
MKSLKATFLSLITLVMAGCNDTSGDQPETLRSDYNESQMDAAIKRARNSIPEFIPVLESGDAESFSVKTPITDDNGTEHFWISDVRYVDGQFVGTIGNDPGIVESVTFGQVWTVGEDEISDWMYMRDGMIHGGYTIDPLLGDSPEDLALRSRLVR